jgi:phosphoribosylformylglycinamidine (FGAM) synthase-like enzyme
MTDEPTPEQIRERRIYRDFGLRDEEYAHICARLDRLPNYVETGMFSVMWSEHCSYKSSKHHLRALPTTGRQVLQGPGENAGIVDIGGGLGVVFKMESHNHPSAIEPYQGAATGVGGIIRDIFTMGARPIALLDSLRFGPIDEPHPPAPSPRCGEGELNVIARPSSGIGTREHNRYLFGHVVAGIAGYGNCVGIPTVGGEAVFDEAYTHNPLVNVMCVGLIRHDHIARGAAAGVGNPVLVVGAKTGRDGIHGATFASVEDPHSRERAAVQVGDPFMEKLLLEACLELIESGAVAGIQDMGAAGLTSSSAEMASRAGSGIDVDVALVPRRETGMTPYEVMLSESQERMLVVVRRGHEEQAQAIFSKWGLDAVVVGHVTAPLSSSQPPPFPQGKGGRGVRSGQGGLLRILEHGRVVGEVPVAALVDEAPVYDRPAARPAYLDDPRLMAADALPESADLATDLLSLLARPTIASKAFVYRQYDTMVRTSTLLRPGADAAVVALPDFKCGIAMTTDGNGRYIYLNPRAGAMHAVAEAARNLVCVGARPLAVTDCLNFGNPEKAGIFYQFVESIQGIAEACRTLGVPVVSGNVSFYNETNGQDIFPTPVIGMVGLVDNLECLTTPDLKAAGDMLVLLGSAATTLGGSEYTAMRSGRPLGPTPPIDLDLEVRVQAMCRELIRAGWARTAHDVADGGLAVALAEMCIAGGRGATLSWSIGGRANVALFGEGAACIVVEVAPEDLPMVERIAALRDVPYKVLGHVTDDGWLTMNLTPQPPLPKEEESTPLFPVREGGTGGLGSHPTTTIELTVTALKERWEGALPWAMQ